MELLFNSEVDQRLIRGFTQRKDKKDPLIEVELEAVLSGLGLTMDEFIDLCILSGCDYVKSIEGLGPNTAFKLIKEYKNIEAVLKHLESVNVEKVKEGKNPKYVLPPADAFNYIAARNEFKLCRSKPAEEMEVACVLCRSNSKSLMRLDLKRSYAMKKPSVNLKSIPD